jgi:tetratricopeptide (TPR) repeat protein
MRKFAGFLAALVVTMPGATVAQVPDKPEMPMLVGDKLGEIEFANSGNAAAQAPFLRGVKLLHNFEYAQAVASFEEAQKADPDFALAYWGEAMAYNHTLWAEQYADKAQAALAKLGATPAQRATKARTAKEKMWLGAVETLYGPGKKFQRDVAYADKMDALAKAYPDDVEAQTFDALATLGRSHGTRDETNYLKAAAILEKLFPTHQRHPGVVHYMIHSYDDPAHAKLGLKAAILYDKIAPESPHALHMTSHIFLALGMWPETVAANRRAISRANEAMAAHHMSMDCGHGPDWLVYAELQQGEDPADDIERCRKTALDAAALANDRTVIGGEEDNVSSFADMLVRRGVEAGNWPDPVRLPSGHFAYARFMLAYGKLLEARHDPVAARNALAEMWTTRSAIAGALSKELPDETQLLPWLDRAISQSEAVVLLASGKKDAGLKALRAAAETEEALPVVFGPPLIQKLSWEMLGDELLLAGDKSGAAIAYRKALAMAPGRRLSTLGLTAATAP